ncbi:MAG: serine kinase [Gammaproteobacteria bacterium]|nr:serine kinase [Gammaproteobacteria bacterium]OUV68015.1 MAG: hypothetical protein CBC93_03315 [Gammaproteobacteria bacterium TMED133]
MLELGVIADDLTGGMMVASLLEREGVRCPLVTSVEALDNLSDDAEAVVIGRKIRLIPPKEAAADAQHSAEGLLEKNTKRIYYKYCATFDSTDDGNIGPIGEALMKTTKTDRVIFCPAFPEYSVTIFQGRMFLGGTMLGESGKRFDPVTPMTNSNLVEVLQSQSKSKVSLVPHSQLVAGKAACDDYISRQIADGANLFIVDAVDDDDVTRIAELTTDWPLTSGADAIPMFMARTWLNTERKVKQRSLLPPAPGYEAVIAGSCAGNTQRQVSHFEDKHPVFRVDLVEAMSNSNFLNKIIDWAKNNINKGPICISTSADVDGVKRAQEKLGRDGAAALADEILGSSAAALKDLGVRKFVVAGGETSGQFFKSLNIEQVQVSSFDNLAGGYCHEASADPISIVTKAGGLGDEKFFFTALERMRQADNQK